MPEQTCQVKIPPGFKDDVLSLLLFICIMKKYDLTESKARDMMLKKDKQRQSYYNYYSAKKWGRADSYDFCINSNVLGIEGTVELITQFVQNFENRQ